MKNPARKRRTIIIGAGAAGLLAGAVLKANGIEVILLEKGRLPGGRMASRHVTDGKTAEGFFDYGIQFFDPRSEYFRKWAAAWLQSGALKVWSSGFFREENGLPTNQREFLCGTFGMRDFAAYLARGLDIRFEQKVIAIATRENNVLLKSEKGQVYEADSLIITTPIPYALELFANSDFPISASERNILSSVSYIVSVVLLALMPNAGMIPKPGGIFLNNDNVPWIGDNNQKGIVQKKAKPGAEFAALTLTASDNFSRYLWDADERTITSSILAACDPWISLQPLATYIHRWRYAEALNPLDLTHFRIKAPFPLYLAGDAFGTGGIEGAVISGINAAEAALQ